MAKPNPTPPARPAPAARPGAAPAAPAAARAAPPVPSPDDTLPGPLSLILSDTLGPGEVLLTAAGETVIVPEDIPAGTYLVGAAPPPETGPAVQALEAFTAAVLTGGDTNKAASELLASLQAAGDPVSLAVLDTVKAHLKP